MLNRSRIDVSRVLGDIDTLSKFGWDSEFGGVTRPSYSPAYEDAARWIAERMRDAGMEVKRDAVGNLIGRLGPDTGPAVICGSHIDSVPGGGNYDGALGVLAGIEVARFLSANTEHLLAAFEVVAFVDEEGAYASLFGSRAMVGLIEQSEIMSAIGRDGQHLADVMTDAGFDPAHIQAARRLPEDVSTYIELHIEQGPVLKGIDRSIGIVLGIVGLQQSEIRFTGVANHAGTTPTDMRRDAFRAACETVVDCYRNFDDNVEAGERLTFGNVRVFPGASNVVPGKAILTQEIRALSEDVIDRRYNANRNIASDVANKYGVSVEANIVTENKPAAMSDKVIDVIRAACESLECAPHRMVSGAGHDAQVMATLCDAGMIFVPSEDGLSHNKKEFTAETDVELGVNVLLESVLILLQQEVVSPL